MSSSSSLPPNNTSEETQNPQTGTTENKNDIDSSTQMLLPTSSTTPDVVRSNTTSVDPSIWKPPQNKKNYLVVYDPALDPSPVKKSKQPNVHVNDFSKPQTEKSVDPRKFLTPADIEKRRKRLLKNKYMPYLAQLHYSYDRNSPGPPPPPPPTSIVITGINNCIHFDQIRRIFSNHGRIYEHEYELHPFHATPLGVCWIRFIDEVPRSPYEEDRKAELDRLLRDGRSLENLQDGHQCALNSIKHLNKSKIQPPANLIFKMRPDEFITVEMDDLAKTKYKQAVKVELEKQRPKRPQPKPNPAASTSASTSSSTSTPSQSATIKHVVKSESFHASSSSPLSTSLPSSPQINGKVPPPNKLDSASSSSLPPHMSRRGSSTNHSPSPLHSVRQHSSRNASPSAPAPSSRIASPLPSNHSSHPSATNDATSTKSSSSSLKKSKSKSSYKLDNKHVSDPDSDSSLDPGPDSSSKSRRPRSKSPQQSSRRRRNSISDSRSPSPIRGSNRSNRRMSYHDTTDHASDDYSRSPSPRYTRKHSSTSRSRYQPSTTASHRKHSYSGRGRKYSSTDLDSSTNSRSPSPYYRRRSSYRYDDYASYSSDESDVSDYYRYSRTGRNRHRHRRYDCPPPPSSRGGLGGASSRRLRRHSSSMSPSPPPRRHRRRSYSSWDSSSDDDSTSSFSSGDERDKVYFHRPSRPRARQPGIQPAREHARSAAPSISNSATATTKSTTPRKPDQYRHRDRVKQEENRGPGNKLAQLTERRRHAIQTKLVQNGNPYLSVDASSLNRLGSGGASLLNDIRQHFSKFGPSDVETDSVVVYIMFDNPEGARKCHVVLNRKSFYGSPLNLTLHDRMDSSHIERDDKKQNSKSSTNQRSFVSSKRPGEYTDNELVDQAKESIYNEILRTFLRDYKIRHIAPRVWEHMDNIKKDGIQDQKQTTKSHVVSSSDIKPDEQQQLKTSSSSMPVTTTSSHTSGILKLPSFARRTKNEQQDVKKHDHHYDKQVSEKESMRSRKHDEVSSKQQQQQHGRDPSSIDDTKKTNKDKIKSEKADVFNDSLPDDSDKPPSPAPVPSTKVKKRKPRKEIVFTSDEEDEEEENNQVDKTQVQKPKEYKAKPSTTKRSKKKVKVEQEQDEKQSVESNTTTITTTAPAATKKETFDNDFIGSEKEQEQSRKVQKIEQKSPTPDPFDSAIAKDDEDLFYAKMAIERARNGQPMRLPEPEEESVEPGGDEGQNDDNRKNDKHHVTGSARTEGYYKVAASEKMAYLMNRKQQEAMANASSTNGTNSSANANAASKADSRSARVNSRRLVQGFEQHKKQIATDTDVLKFNQLKSRKKQLKFSRSSIHWYGLYSMESIPTGEMVIEYVGELIQHQVAERREKQYERMGIGSSYLFRVDDDQVVDATKKGNLGRLINHSCNPNCTARIITINGQKKIVIYAKSNIEPGDEITYDYHFPLEDEKIVCLCGEPNCRGSLN